jgi:hypothetical protein
VVCRASPRRPGDAARRLSCSTTQQRSHDYCGQPATRAPRPQNSTAPALDTVGGTLRLLVCCVACTQPHVRRRTAATAVGQLRIHAMSACVLLLLPRHAAWRLMHACCPQHPQQA